MEGGREGMREGTREGMRGGNEGRVEKQGGSVGGRHYSVTNFWLDNTVVDKHSLYYQRVKLQKQQLN